jgi:hypothetical protein
MADTANMVIIDQCELITGIQAKNKVQVKAELLQFIKNEDAEGLLSNTEDLLYLFEVSAILSNHTSSELITEELIAACTDKEVIHKGSKVRNPEEITNLLTLISFNHSDIVVERADNRKGYFLKHENLFVHLSNFQQGVDGESVDLVHCTLTLTYISSLDVLKTLCPQHLFNKKNWSVKKRGSKKVLSSDGWTRHQIIELLEDRKIVNYGR